MKKERICYLISILLSMIGTKALAYDIKVENAKGVVIYYNYINDRTELEVTTGDNYAGYSGSVVIPEEVTYMNITRKVTRIGAGAFDFCVDLVSITMPNSVTTIGEQSFGGCGFTSVTIPNSVLSIEGYAFAACRALTSFTLPSSVTSFAERALELCSSLSSISVETGNPKYDSRDNCNCIIETESNKLIAGCNSSFIPDNVTEIGNWAFGECSGLTSITIPNGITIIGNGAFGRCSGLTSITIPNSVKSIGDFAFSECSSLTSFTLPNSVTSIGETILGSCTDLSSISVETGNPKYDSRDNCNGIIETETNTLIAGCQNTLIPDNVTSLGNGAFYSCKNLTSITIPNSVTTIGASAFYDCSKLASVNMSNSVTTIGASAFNSCSSLTYIDLPSSVQSIGNYAFCICGFTSITIPNSISIIADGVFYGCNNLISVTIPESVTTICMMAFSSCSALKSITIPNSVTSIGNNAFHGCSSLTSITLPNSISSIGEQVFGWVDLQEVISNIENPFTIITNTFSDNTYNNGTLYVPAGSLDKYKATTSWNNFKKIEENSHTRIIDLKDNETDVIKRYTIDGRVTKNSHKGISIVKMNNGKTKKVITQ